MLGNVVEKKLKRRRRSKKTQDALNARLVCAFSIFQQIKQIFSKNTSKDKENGHGQSPDHKITEYFFVRRSNRRTAKEIEVFYATPY
jgi:hypothetical protein